MRTVIVIQARTGSTRLPRKILLPLAGAPLLQRMVERVRGSSTPAAIVVATTHLAEDEPVRDICRTIGVPCFNGHATDLLERHLQAAMSLGADLVVKIPSDCPLIDPAVIDRVLHTALARYHDVDYTSNLHPPTYPDGNDVEAMPLHVLQTAWREASRPFEREHTTPFIWERPGRFRLANVTWETGDDLAMTHRWTIDYAEDYAFLCAVYDELWSPANPLFSLNDVLGLLKQRPEIHAINAHLAGVNWYRDHLHELTTIAPTMTRMPGP